MIRYSVSRGELIAAIEEHRPGWMVRAKESTAEAKKKRRVDEGDGIWGEIKAVFATLQHFKCIYCEKSLPRERVDGEDSLGKGAVEYDVEHFRPKNRVQDWPTAEQRKARTFKYASKVRMGEATGYVRLAFDVSNYALSCKTCNSGHKRDWFPIAGETNKRLSDRAKLDGVELPLLMLPLGDDADDPEDVIGWMGPVAIPKYPRGYEKLRAQVCIDLFSLNPRDDIYEERCKAIALLWPKLEMHRKAGPIEAKALEETISSNITDRHPVAACRRAFVKLYRSDRKQAEAIYAGCDAYLTTREPAVFQAR